MSLATISLLLLLFSASISANENPSAYEELQNYDFPIGILPKGVIGYELNPKTGEFSAYFNGSCRFMLSSYELNYKPVIKGVISKGMLRKLSGVSVKVVLIWLNIVEVRRKGDNLQFSVGITSANFPIKSFVECPSCECGLDYIHEDEKKFI
ncbi:uncharacterized protein At5g01610 [Nicotiana sylvestris]|uniref:Uncharacterized protein LOC104222312 n=1 Tax=Nicotiana sylvestris TaxID=4096 RepID=A0A1U7W3Q4_NICSY|nr:PREDICTED: uncharacterized protein LOC104222312 [Nicotiana sylvestris]